MAHNIKNVEILQKKSKTHKIVFKAERNNVEHFNVESGSSGSVYRITKNNNVDGGFWGCTCNWAKYQPQGKSVACSHVQKVVTYIAANDGYKAKVRLSSTPTNHLHRKTVHVGNSGVKVTLRK